MENQWPARATGHYAHMGISHVLWVYITGMIEKDHYVITPL